MKPFNCILIDDEPAARILLRKLLEPFEEIEIIDEAAGVAEGIDLIEDLVPDIVFLDIEMPDGTGFDLIRELQYRNLTPDVIFITAYDHYAIEAIRSSAFDYLMKPVKPSQLKKAINRLKCHRTQISKDDIHEMLLNADKSDKIKINIRSGFILLNPSEIIHCSADGNYTTIFLADGSREVSSQNLGSLSSVLPEKHFIKISRSEIINLQYLKKVNRPLKKCYLKVNDKTIELKITPRFIKPLEDKCC